MSRGDAPLSIHAQAKREPRPIAIYRTCDPSIQTIPKEQVDEARWLCRASERDLHLLRGILYRVHVSTDKQAQLDALIAELDALRERARQLFDDGMDLIHGAPAIGGRRR